MSSQPSDLSAGDLPFSRLLYLLHHVFLPPKLPHGDDSNPESDDALIGVVQGCLLEFADTASESTKAAILEAHDAMRNLRQMRDASGHIHEDALRQALLHISSEGGQATIPVQVTEQNAGLLIRKTGDGAVFESFELSPTNDAVFATKGRLIRLFPATATHVSNKTLAQKDFRASISNTLAKMSHQIVEGARPKIKKAGEFHVENRDTTSPELVTQLLQNIVLGCGAEAHLQRIRKNTREEVCWNSSALPWRRTPTWLLARVTLQLIFHRMSSSDQETYKKFIVYFLAHVMDAASATGFSSETLHIMSSKITRRLTKLKQCEGGTWIDPIRRALGKTTKLLEERWSSIRTSAEHSIDLAGLSNLDLDRDIRLHLPKLDNFLSTISQRKYGANNESVSPRSQVPEFPPTVLPSLSFGNYSADYKAFQLAEVEDWVATNLTSWTKDNIEGPDTCDSLAKLLYEYHNLAEAYYQHSPESISRMLLVLLEIWTAMDRTATTIMPLLKDYTPGIPLSLFQGLLLACRSDMDRLLQAEEYWHQRNNSVKQLVKGHILLSFGESDCFSCRYFRQSPALRKLHDDIQEQARKEKLEKLEELRRLKKRYSDLMDLHNQTSCQYYDTTDRWGDPVTRHRSPCSHCRYKTEAHSLSITVHEWPLPTNKFQARSTVFELDPPSAFRAWRDATVYFLGDVLRRHDPTAKRPKSRYALKDYGGLQRWYKAGASLSQRIFPLSEAKPHLGTHRKNRLIVDLDEENVCVNNGLILQPFDDERGTFLTLFQNSDHVLYACTVDLPLRSAAMEPFLLRDCETLSGRTPNESVAGQNLCPDHFSIGEGKALMSLSYGHEVRWLSLLTHLKSPQIDFSKPETATFVLAICLRAGPNAFAQVQRQSQEFLTEQHFTKQLSETLDTRVSYIEKNPETYLGLWCFTMMASKALTMNTYHQPAFLGILARCRETSYQWAMKLSAKSLATDDDEQRMQSRDMMFGVALVCMDTFSIDPFHLDNTLMTRAGSTLIEMAILIHDNAELRKPLQDNPLEDFLFDRWRVVMHRSSPIVRRLTLSNNNRMLDLAIENCWAAYSRDEAWHCVPAARYWLETRSNSLQVLYNTLTGELLVGGSPLSRLPASYKSNPLYHPLFGRAALDVMPSSLPGMSFSGQNKFQGHEVHFGMQRAVCGSAEDDLLILAKHEGSAYDLVPSHTLREHIPDMLVRSFVHWYDHNRGEIELRPSSSPWSRNPSGWRLKRHRGAWTLARGSEHMISPSSETAVLITKILAPMDTVMHLHMVYCKSTGQFEVHLPRLNLDFHLQRTNQTLQSRQFPGMQIDADQSIGTLIGLRSRLVLVGPSESDDRVVLIPEGSIKYSRSHSCKHINVAAVSGTASRVQSYWIDSQLGRLIDNGTLQSKLFLSYLHALTAYCIPDPFTMHTGTEQALGILESAAVRSCNTLTSENAVLLSQLANLTPGREFYPPDLRVMQSVTWCDELSVLAQPGQFRILADKIMQQVQRVRFLYPHQDIPKMDINPSNMYLVEREVIRSSGLYIAGFGADAFTIKHDSHYRSRDQAERSGEALLSARIVSKTLGRCQFLDSQADSNLSTKLHDILKITPGTMASVHKPILKHIRYDKKWLETPELAASELWCRLHYALAHSTQPTSRYHIATWLATMAYSQRNFQPVVSVLYALATIPDVGAVALPEAELYDLAQGCDVDQASLKGITQDNAKTFFQCPESRLPKFRDETNRQAAVRRKEMYESRLSIAVARFVDHLMPQWPCPEPQWSQANGDMDTYINVRTTMSQVATKWKTWYRNLLVRQYLEELASVMGQQDVRAPTAIPPRSEPLPAPPGRPRGFIDLSDLFDHDILGSVKGSAAEGRDHEFGLKLQEILDSLETTASSEYHQQYLADLRFSNSSVDEGQHIQALDLPLSCMRTHLDQHQRQCRDHVDSLYKSMVEDTSGNPPFTPSHSTSSAMSEIHSIIRGAKFWPRTSPLFFLGHLRRDRWSALPRHWKKRIVAFGLAITELQRSIRLLRACGNDADLVKELRNVGHEDWNPHDHPEWLLLECESDILIRHVQKCIAEQMMTPPDNKNAVMQLNMGEGKSSVIVPIVASALGDGSQVVRVIVAKPQFKQMYQLLISRLAGMIGRRVYQLPISRDIVLKEAEVDTIRQIAGECKKNGGVMLVQPEHLLSFQLMGLDQQISTSGAVGTKLLDTQVSFDKQSRDIIDESDENFSVRFELVYTMGQQRPIENSPARWSVLQEILGLIKQLAYEVSSQSPQSLEIFEWQGESWRFPRIRILDTLGSEKLLDLLASKICHHGLDGFPISRQPEDRREAVRRYITKSSLSKEEIAAVEEGPFWRDGAIDTLLMLRGLMAQGIIAFSLGQKRWRVNYGVDQNRDPKTRLAVPFRAKDDPAPRAEFSHPDVAIFLTCLSYYYSGLDCEELLGAFDLLKQDDQAEPEYHIWRTSAPTLPPAFRELIGVNLRDKVQFELEIFPHLRYSKGAIDYFLSRLVFAKEMREFPHKLSTSGWDLGKPKVHPTTGFSGTNDSRYILPLTVRQLDLPEQRHTNALVLRYLLQSENSTHLLSKRTGSTKDMSDGESFLQTVCTFEQETRVILDVGAQVIDLTNRQVAESWLKAAQGRRGDAQAVIYFDEEDVLSVLDQNGQSEPFQTSHFAKQTENCLVFLDEAHTRGTDLRLPQNYRAAVTLGANLTKDRLLQACMRMRKLGNGQSVIFCVPEEIGNRIKFRKKAAGKIDSEVSVSDILTWAISDTFRDTERSVPLWVAQGLRFGRHNQLWKQFEDGPLDNVTNWAKGFLEDESQSLEQRYRPGLTRQDMLETDQETGNTFEKRIANHCSQFGHLNFGAAGLQEEQERELAPEAEEERQVERPKAAIPEPHCVHPGVETFVLTGDIQRQSGAFLPAFATLSTTSASKHLNVQEFPQSLLVTNDFARTVKLKKSLRDRSDFFQRSVSYVLTTNAGSLKITEDKTQMVVISPYEAQALIRMIGASKHVTLHLYAPRINMDQQPLDRLDLYTVPVRANIHIPGRLAVLLNLFAGQLYLRTYDEYTRVCEALGLAWDAVAADEAEIEADGFIPRDRRAGGTLVNRTRFTRSPTKFLQVFMTNVRQNNQNIDKTHMGRLLNGSLLAREDFEEVDEEAGRAAA